MVTLRLSKTLSREFPVLDGKPQRAFTLNREGFVVASVIYREGDDLEQ